MKIKWAIKEKNLPTGQSDINDIPWAFSFPSSSSPSSPCHPIVILVRCHWVWWRHCQLLFCSCSRSHPVNSCSWWWFWVVGWWLWLLWSLSVVSTNFVSKKKDDNRKREKHTSFLFHFWVSSSPCCPSLLPLPFRSSPLFIGKLRMKWQEFIVSYFTWYCTK